MDGVQAPDDCCVSVKVRASVFMRVRNSVGFQVPEHGSADIMGSAWVEYRVRLWWSVRNRVRISLPVHWSLG